MACGLISPTIEVTTPAAPVDSWSISEKLSIAMNFLT
jgi:hypothetical protein